MENTRNFLYPIRRIILGSTLLALPLVSFASPLTDAKLNSMNEYALPAKATVKIKGVVSDAQGPVIGASVVEKGTTNGTITDMDGNFELNVPTGATIVISYIGYVEQQIVIGSNHNLTIKLKEDNKMLEEVVVVGYGAQKKVNLTGSVASINVAEVAESRPLTNVSQALAGMAAGVNVSASNNRPGDDKTSITVRGQGTLNDAAPLVIIDGVESNINSVNPQDIETMSVLKDAASAAIYGSRAANGVILITTKKGKSGKINLEYNGYVSRESIRKTLTPVSNYADYMQLMNEGLKNSNPSATLPFSEASIKAWRENNDPLKYPNTDWIDETFRPSVSTNHVISVSGGAEKLRFYGSFGFMNNPGVMENTGMKRYTGRFNIEADVKPWLTLGTQLNGNVTDIGPAAGIVDQIFTYAGATSPGMVLRAPDGRYGGANNNEDENQIYNNNPLVRLNRLTGDNRSNNLRSRFFGTLKPFKGFTLTGSFSYEYTDRYLSSKPVFIDQWDFLANQVENSNKGRTYLTNTSGRTERLFNDLVAHYETSLLNKQLNVSAMLGGSQELYTTKSFTATRYDLIDLGLNTLSAATGESSSDGSFSQYALRSYFGRLNLNWKEKYLFEFNLRADGSSRFMPNKRWGYFPSASAAWRIDQESFMQSLVNKGLSSLKLRASYGALGNNAVGNYSALDLYSLKDAANRSFSYPLNGMLVTGVGVAAISNSFLTWESTYVADLGVDFGFFNNRLTGTFDYFNKRTVDILIDLPAPYVRGVATLPKQNSAIVTNKGFELTLGWQDKVKDFSYGISGNFTYVTNNVDKFKGKDKSGQSISGANLIWEGHPINAQYGLRVDRILQTDEDMKLVQAMIDNAPTNEATGQKYTEKQIFAFGVPQKGDFLYKDLNGDGLINNNDRDILSDGPNPKFLFGLNFNASWKGFDFAVLTQASFGARVVWIHSPYNTPTVRLGYQINKEVAEGRWFEGRTDATYPRLLQYQDTRNTQASDFYLQNHDFLKIRNIQLGYTLPQKWAEKASLSRVRIYGSLENYFTFTGFKGFDPEFYGMDYPSMKQAVIGLNLIF